MLIALGEMSDAVAAVGAARLARPVSDRKSGRTGTWAAAAYRQPLQLLTGRPRHISSRGLRSGNLGTRLLRLTAVRSVVSRAATAGAVTIVLSACALTAAHPGGSSPSPTGPVAGTPIRVLTTPASPPPTTVKGHSCFVPEEDSSGGNVPDRGVLSVDLNPVGALAEWLPGMNQRPCRAQLTQLGQTAARHLAAAVNTGQAIKVGAAYSCPAGDLSSVTLFFRYPGPMVEMVSVELNGCGWITAPGRISRFTPPAMQTELGTLAPPVKYRV